MERQLSGTPAEAYDMSGNILELDRISYGYADGGRKRMILDELSYTFEESRFYTILGPSGSGKTTLLALAGALDVPESGRILYKGTDIRQTGLTRFRHDKMAIIFQKYNLTDYLSGVENVESNVRVKGGAAKKKELAYQILDSMGIVKTKADRRVTRLSGGEQQRVAIARALARDVDLIFGDEPTGALDTATTREVIALFHRLSHEYGKTIILVTHSDEVAQKSDIILRLQDGKLYETQRLIPADEADVRVADSL